MVDETHTKPNLVSIEDKRKEREKGSKEAKYMISHLENLLEKVIAGEINHLVTIHESDSNTQTAFSGNSHNPFEMYFHLNNTISDMYAEVYLIPEEYDE